MTEMTSAIIYFSLVIGGMILTMIMPDLFNEPRRNNSGRPQIENNIVNQGRSTRAYEAMTTCIQ